MGLLTHNKKRKKKERRRKKKERKKEKKEKMNLYNNVKQALEKKRVCKYTILRVGQCMYI